MPGGPANVVRLSVGDVVSIGGVGSNSTSHGSFSFASGLRCARLFPSKSLAWLLATMSALASTSASVLD